MHRFVVLLITVVVCLWTIPAYATICGVTPETLIVLDRSGSMGESGSFTGSKWSIATQSVNSLVQNFGGQMAIGLMLFPKPNGGPCSPAIVNVGPSTASGPAINSAMMSTYPDGSTPIDGSLNAAHSYFIANGGGKIQNVVLITDGFETCNGYPQNAAGKLFASGIKTFVVGFGVGVKPASLNAIAMAGGTNQYYQADNPSQLNQALSTIASQISCCGNGVLDPGESCDTAIPQGQLGACQISCLSSDPCMEAISSGNGCIATCSFMPIVAPMTGDGCCPPGATYDNDKDCPNSCGNGQIEMGETCDPAIPTGTLGACPDTCDDDDPCTSGMFVGQDCTLSCTYQNICVCGNSALDPGELCDTKIPLGNPGACPLSCDDQDPCTEDLLIGWGCDARCVYKLLEADLEISDGCCPLGKTSRHDADCLPPCTPDLQIDCVDPCETVICPDEQFCGPDGQCHAWPNTDPESGSNEEEGNENSKEAQEPQEPQEPMDHLTSHGDQDDGIVLGGCSCDLRAGESDTAVMAAFLFLGLIFLLSRRSQG